jgi:hypothetical protein
MENPTTVLERNEYSSPTSVTEFPDDIIQDVNFNRRRQAIIARFPQFDGPSHDWTPTERHIPINQYHLRRRPQIRCPGCLYGDLGQRAHMESPFGCLYIGQSIRLP